MIKRLLSCLENICAVCLCILAFSVLFQILARMIFHIPATWTVEIESDQTAFNILGDICTYFFLVTLAYGCYDRMLSEWKAAIPTVEWLTYGYLYLVMLLGTMFMIYAKVMHTRKYLKNRTKEAETCIKS